MPLDGAGYNASNDAMLTILIATLLAYCIGSISSAVIVCRLAGLPDPRATGSNNPGATNVLRIGGKKAAIATLLGDVLKGAVPVLIAHQINPSPVMAGPVMLAAFFGHLYPLFFKFQGGKGVATAIGAIFALSLPVAMMVVATWGLVVYIFRISSLGALAAALVAPFYTAWLLNMEYAMVIGIMSLFLFWRHLANIQRLLKGKESKIGKKSSISN